MNYTIKDFKTDFPDQDACLDYVFKHRFGTKPTCPYKYCKKATTWHKIKKRKAYACAQCGYQIHPLAGTIFHKSSIDLTFWFFAIYKFANSRNGVAAKELQRDLGVTYKTAWRIAKQIRKLMEMSELRLSGTVEIDEAYIGKSRTEGRRDMPKVLGMVQRGGGARAIKVDSLKMFNVPPIVNSEVAKGSNLMTDSASVYKQYNFEGYNLNKVNHSKKEYATGVVHINTVEGFFGQIKRSISGTYHHVSEQHLQGYLDEFSWRLTNVRTGIPLFPLLLMRVFQVPSVKDSENLAF